MFGAYELLEICGEGGMGSVWLARHTRLDRKVALKILHSSLAVNGELVNRFFAEARAVNRISHENIVEITDFIEEEDSAPCYVMELLQGRDLFDVLEEHVSGPLELQRSIHIAIQVAKALVAVHNAGIVHRDVKPENVFITERHGDCDFVKLLDFGVAKLLDPSVDDHVAVVNTTAGAVLGTPAYMSPEQASGISIDHRSDIYAFGIMLFELVTGERPFKGETFGALVVQHLTVEAPQPSSIRPAAGELPKLLDTLITNCLAKDPNERIQTMAGVQEILSQIERGIMGSPATEPRTSPQPSPVRAAAPTQCVTSPRPALGKKLGKKLGATSMLERGATIAIDFGTTSSCVAVFQDGAATVLRNQEGSRTTPSTVSWNAGAEVCVGASAQRKRVTNPTRSFFGVKRLLGRRMSESGLRSLIDPLPYQVEAADDGVVSLKVDGNNYSPREVIAPILSKLREVAEDHLRGPVTDAVVTVPAQFGLAQRRALKEAAAMAGLNIRTLISDAAAALLARAPTLEQTSTSVVLDLGAGSFEASVIRVEGGVIEVLATCSEEYVAGAAFDRRLVKLLAKEFEQLHGIDLTKDPTALQRLYEAAEAAKIELSTSRVAEVSLPFITAIAGSAVELRTQLDRTQLASCCADLLAGVERLCRTALRDSKCMTEKISEVLLVGGMSRMPALGLIASRCFGKQPSKVLNPEEAVAIGAALLAGTAGSGAGPTVVELAIGTIGLCTGGTSSELIGANTPLPVRVTKVLTTDADGALPEVTIHQQINDRQTCNQQVASLKAGQSLGPSTTVEVTFILDMDGMISVNAIDKHTGRTAPVTMNYTSL